MILATAGHIDHGKTALVRALTGVALVLVLTDAFGMAQRPFTIGAILAQSAAVACAFVALGSGSLQRADVAPFATLALVALMALGPPRSTLK